MKRFSTIITNGKYSVECDTYNGYYMVFKNCGMFKQQISKIYYRKGNAIKFYNKVNCDT